MSKYPKSSSWDPVTNGRPEPGYRCGTCPACRFPDGVTPCELDPRMSVEPQSDGHIYVKRPGGWWERLP